MKPQSSDQNRKRQAAEKRGRRAELIAAAHVSLRGYQLLARRYKTGAGEIDLIAKRNDTLAFVEVKARETIDLSIDAVTPTARRRIERAGRVFLSKNPSYAEFGVRYDIIAVRGLSVHWLRDAWRENE